jgi:hypothetical protein
MTDFWLSCGHHFLDRDEGGVYVVTDDFLKIYLARPELFPPPNACPVERNLYNALLAEPRRPVAASEIQTITDSDARENWELLITFRDHLLAHKTLEASYVDLMRRGVGKTPPLFINQLVHVILRNALDTTAEHRNQRRHWQLAAACDATCRAETECPARIPANSGLFAINREISVCVRLRGGAGRTRTSNQTVIAETRVNQGSPH